MRTLLTGLSRFCLAAWCGAGTLFVYVAIRPIRSPQFDSIQKAIITQIVFPGYYAIGFLLLGVGFATSLLALRNRRRWISTVLAGIALLLMLVDWFYIYSPLATMIADQIENHVAPPSNFRSYHIASMVINGIGLLFSGLAALTACFSNGVAKRCREL